MFDDPRNPKKRVDPDQFEEFDPEVARQMGAFEEDALSPEDAEESLVIEWEEDEDQNREGDE